MRAELVIAMVVLASATVFAAGKEPPGVAELAIGKPAPAFQLPATDGKTYAFKDVAGEKGTLIVFSCNHCPYATGYQQRIMDLTTKFKPQGIGVAMISSNDAKAYPDDSFEMMKERATATKYNFPYLYDETQSVALNYGPKVTPHVFLFDAKRNLVYRGRIDDSVKDNKVTRRELAEALAALVTGKSIPTATTTAFGCSIKWRTDVLEGSKKTSEL